MLKKRNNGADEEKRPWTPEEWQEWRAYLIREGRLRPAKAPFDMEAWEKLPRPDIDSETAAWIIRDLIENR